jgi:hypothetical protein
VSPNLVPREEITFYNWIEPENKSKENCLTLDLTLSMIELRSSNASLNIFDIIMVDSRNLDADASSKDLMKSTTDFNNNGITQSSYNNNLVTPSMSTTQLQLNVRSKLSGRFSVLNNQEAGIYLIPKYTQVGFSNLNFYQILSENDNIITKQSSRFFQTFRIGNENIGTSENANSHIKFQIFDDITRTFSEDIFFMGSVIGKIEGTIQINKIPLIRQIMCGVHTERGFDISSISVNLHPSPGTQINSFKEDTAPPELRILSNQSNNLLSQLLKGTNLTQYSQSFREINAQIMQIMNELKTVLGKSFKESALYYNYVNNKDLFKAQKVMLELGISILKIIESLNLEQRAIGFEILILINNRAEFDLGTVWRAWFMDQNSTTFFRDSVLINDKIIENFILFDNMCLDFVLERMSRGKSIDKESKVFVEYFLSVAYFRTPKFRKAFLEAIGKDLFTDHKSYLELEKGSTSIEEFLNLDPVNNLILWEVIFYKRLEKALSNINFSFNGNLMAASPNGTNNNSSDNEISERLKETDLIVKKEAEWKNRLAKRGLAFYNMVSKLAKYIEYKIVKSMDIKWNNIPGFDIIFEAIHKELLNREVTTYSSQLIEVMTLFVNDSDVINNFTRSILHKTK